MTNYIYRLYLILIKLQAIYKDLNLKNCHTSNTKFSQKINKPKILIFSRSIYRHRQPFIFLISDISCQLSTSIKVEQTNNQSKCRFIEEEEAIILINSGAGSILNDFALL